MWISRSQGHSLKPYLGNIFPCEKPSAPELAAIRIEYICNYPHENGSGHAGSNTRRQRGGNLFSRACLIGDLVFCPNGHTSSVFPAMVKAWKTDENLFYQRLRELYLVMVWLSLVGWQLLCRCSQAKSSCGYMERSTNQPPLFWRSIAGQGFSYSWGWQAICGTDEGSESLHVISMFAGAVVNVGLNFS